MIVQNIILIFFYRDWTVNIGADDVSAKRKTLKELLRNND